MLSTLWFVATDLEGTCRMRLKKDIIGWQYPGESRTKGVFFMEQRRLGKTEHMSSLLTFGGAALLKVTQAEANAAIEMAVGHGVNHFDVAPTYGQAEMHLAPWMEKHHKEIFLACKTQARSKARAWESIKRSLETLRVDYFDLYQFHGVDDLETLNVILGPEGALEAVLEAREQKLVRHIGITGHRPFLQVEALNRFAFDTVLFPLNPVIAAHTDDLNDFVTLLGIAQQKDVGVIAMKALAKRLCTPGMRGSITRALFHSCTACSCSSARKATRAMAS
jgi:aryl-alcohol dehydrogenase-like predicted oxidoreductase